MLEAKSPINLIPRQTDSLPPFQSIVQNPQEAGRNGQGTGVPRRHLIYLETEFVVWLLATCSSVFVSFV